MKSSPLQYVGKRRRNASDSRLTPHLQTKYVLVFLFCFFNSLMPDVERQTESIADTVAPGQVTVKRFSG